ncbi:MAG: MogA/MoaB family molybdenum cofactor biosynthesis protein [Candidatus Bathyarchaeia archaeon]|nr:MogA/MoaB family molybdenum cofactor biosynthesis protein [Candidatus Bathyarchaeota archaeon]
MSETAAKHKADVPKILNFAVIVCSTSRYEEYLKTGKYGDQSGDLIVQIVKSNGHRVTMRRLVSDDKQEIQRAVLRALRSRKTDVVVTSGGTGISPKDVTIEAVQPLLEKDLPGFGQLFRMLSYEKIGSPALLTRAIAGVAYGKPVFCLPGSPQSVSLALENLILPEAGHILKHAREK